MNRIIQTERTVEEVEGQALANLGVVVREASKPASKSGHESIMDSLRAAGFRITPQRLAVLGAFQTHSDHISLTEIRNRARARCPSVSMETISTILEGLKIRGTLVELEIRGMPHFELVAGASRHNHIVCSQCDRVEGIELHYLADLEMRMKRDHGFVADLNNLTITGKCSRCRTICSSATL